MKLLLAPLLGVLMGIAPALAQKQPVPLTPTEAYRRARVWPRTSGKSRNRTLEIDAAAEAERVRRARRYAKRFKLEDWRGKLLFDLGLLYVIAQLPEGAERAFTAYLRDPAEDVALARKLLLSALVEQKKWEAATSAAKQLLDDTNYDWDTDEYVRPLIEGLRTVRLDEAISLSEKRNLRLLPLVEGQDIDEGLAAAILERVAQLGEMYIESGNAGKAEELFSSLRSRLQHSHLSSNKKVMRHVESAVGRAMLLGRFAPPIEGIKYIDTPKLDIEALKGKVILLDFFAHWCGPCVESFPALNSLKEKYEAKGLVIVVVTRFYGYFGQQKNLTEQQELRLLRSLKVERKAKPGFVISTEASLAVYGVVGYPTIALIDRASKVRAIKLGAEVEGAIEGTIQALLAETSSSP
jgi:thiol-disulfide isomerase/thioredoxin